MRRGLFDYRVDGPALEALFCTDGPDEAPCMGSPAIPVIRRGGDERTYVGDALCRRHATGPLRLRARLLRVHG